MADSQCKDRSHGDATCGHDQAIAANRPFRLYRGERRSDAFSACPWGHGICRHATVPDYGRAKAREPAAGNDGITLGYFQVTGGRLADGRPFVDAGDAGPAQVVIINEAMARPLFRKENPIGHRI